MFLSADLTPAPRGPLDDFWYQPVGMPSASGVRVSAGTALSISTLYACAMVLSQTMATVPLHMYRRLARGKDRATDHPLYRLLHIRPNRWQTSYQWRQMLQWHLVLRYNAYSRIIKDAMGRPVELIPLHPDHMTVERIMGPDGVMSFRYRYHPAGGEEQVYYRDQILHIRGLSSDGIEGFSMLDAQRDSIGEAIAAQQYNARRMANNAQPGGVLEWPGAFKDDAEREKFRASWQRAQAGLNQGKTAVLERGMQWKEVGVKNTDLQFIELRKLKSFDICGIFRMPPHKVANLERATFSNIEHSGIEFVTDTIQPWAVNWEQELTSQLLDEDEQREYFIEFLLDGLLRGDSRARAELYAKRFQTGSLSPNDIRELENENPVPGGDRYFVPANMVPVDRADDIVDRGAPAPAPAPADGESEREREMEEASADRIVRREALALTRALNRGDQPFADAARAFYAAHVALVADVMRIDQDLAAEYCERRAADAERAAGQGGAEGWLRHLEHCGVEDLLEIARQHRPSSDMRQLAISIGKLAAATANRPPQVAPAHVTIAEGAVQATIPVHVDGPRINVEAAQTHIAEGAIQLAVDGKARATRTVVERRDDNGDILQYRTDSIEGER